MRQAYLTGVSGDDVSSAYGEDVRPPDNQPQYLLDDKNHYNAHPPTLRQCQSGQKWIVLRMFLQEYNAHASVSGLLLLPCRQGLSVQHMSILA
jgi:hypothetical protein